MEDNRKDRKALVTGATGWIGPAIVMELAKARMDIVIHFRSNPATAEQLAKEVRKLGQKAFTIQGDLTLRQDCKSILKKVSDEFGGVDILVNNAGYYSNKPLMQITDEEWDTQIKTDLYGGFQMIRDFADRMILNKWGRIINISSISSLNYIVNEGAYCVAKAGINMLTKSFAAELGCYGITVNAVAPGPTLKHDEEHPPKPQDYPEHALIPDRRPGHAAEVASLIIYLVSDEAAHLNGQVIAIDGGVSSVLTWQA